MPVDGRGCGALHALYAAARDGDPDAVQRARQSLERTGTALPAETVDAIDRAIAAEEYATVAQLMAPVLFDDDGGPVLDGRRARLIGTLLYAFGYLASFVLFFRARSRQSIVKRLRWAYRRVGVDIRDTETDDGIERTVFRCPYRNIGASRWGDRHVCHDVLDRVDDGYVTFLARHRNIEYQRPRACTASACCYSEVSEQ